MIQNWKKLGLINLPGDGNIKQSHYSVPFAMPITNEIVRIYYSPRDNENRSFVTYADINLFTREVMSTSDQPILTHGSLGLFDDSGVVLFQILKINNVNYLYYSGWMVGVTVPFYFWVGLAIDKGNGVYEKVSQAPILPCHSEDPFLTGAPYVIHEANTWKMWYISGTSWV